MILLSEDLPRGREDPRRSPLRIFLARGGSSRPAGEEDLPHERRILAARVREDLLARGSSSPAEEDLPRRRPA